ncbi:MAG: hypothetical protein CMQ24_02575 [Gammaproteobacteria bacterium]|nr:hypothetical protein [Gammaproteobacteria bacterium]
MPGDRALVVGDTAGGVHAFDGASGVCSWARQWMHDGGVMAMAVHPSEAIFATAGQDGRVLIWDVSMAEVQATIEVGRSWVEHLAWSPDGQCLAAASSRRVFVYRSDGSEIWRSGTHPSTVSALAWSGNGELATACYGRVTFLDAVSGKARQTLEWKGSLVSMVLSPSGDIVACGSQDNSVHFWRRSTAEDSMMSGYQGKPLALAFDDSSTLLATGGGNDVTVWSFAGGGPEGSRPGTLTAHEQPVSTLSFARQGMRLASGDRVGGVIVWSLYEDGEGGPVGVGVVGGHVAELFWRRDGNGLAALDARGGVTVWRVG